MIEEFLVESRSLNRGWWIFKLHESCVQRGIWPRLATPSLDFECPTGVALPLLDRLILLNASRSRRLRIAPAIAFRRLDYGGRIRGVWRRRPGVVRYLLKVWLGQGPWSFAAWGCLGRIVLFLVSALVGLARGRRRV